MHRRDIGVENGRNATPWVEGSLIEGRIAQ